MKENELLINTAAAKLEAIQANISELAEAGAGTILAEPGATRYAEEPTLLLMPYACEGLANIDIAAKVHTTKVVLCLLACIIIIIAALWLL